MSFFMEVRDVDLDVAQAKNISERSTSDGGYPFKLKPTLFRRRVTKLYIADWRAGQELLADDADWDAPTWSMRAEELPRLQATIGALCHAIPQGFAFVATWVNEPLEHNVELSCTELLELVRRSELNGKTRYRVKP